MLQLFILQIFSKSYHLRIIANILKPFLQLHAGLRERVKWEVILERFICLFSGIRAELGLSDWLEQILSAFSWLWRKRQTLTVVGRSFLPTYCWLRFLREPWALRTFQSFPSSALRWEWADISPWGAGPASAFEVRHLEVESLHARGNLNKQ